MSVTMDEGTILKWLRAHRSEVKRGDVIAEVASDKAHFDLTAEADGTLHILAPEGSSQPVGAVIAAIGEVAQEGIGDRVVSQQAEPRIEERRERVRRAPRTSIRGRTDRSAARISPLARRLAADLGLELGDVVGSGPDGLVVKADVLALVDQQASASDTGWVRPSPMQLAIANTTLASKTSVPHFYMGAELRMESTLKALRQLAQSHPGAHRVTITHVLVKACADTLARHPKLNRSWLDGGFRTNPSVNIGVAVALDDGLVVPVVACADQMSLIEVADAVRRVVERARQGTLDAAELTGGSLTLSNLGTFGVDEFIAIINHPQASILATGAVRKRAVVDDGKLTVGDVLRVNLSCDHRVAYGSDAAQFLDELRARVESAESWAA